MFSIRQIFGHQERGTLFDAMVDKLGLREAMVSRPNSAGVMRRADARCAQCGQETACSQWLAERETADEAPSYCRNHDLFERIKHDIEAEGGLHLAS